MEKPASATRGIPTPLVEHCWPPHVKTTPYALGMTEAPRPTEDPHTLQSVHNEARNSLTNMHLPPEYAITDDVATVHAAVQPHLEPTKAEWDAETLLRTAEGAIHYFHHQLQLIRGQPNPHWAKLPWKLIRALLDGSGPKDTQSLRHTMASLGNSGINGIRIGCATPSSLPPTFCRVGNAIGQLNGVDQYLFVRYGPGGGNMNFRLHSVAIPEADQELPKSPAERDLPPTFAPVKSVNGGVSTGPHWVGNGVAYWLLASTSEPVEVPKDRKADVPPSKGRKKGKQKHKQASKGVKQRLTAQSVAVEVLKLSDIVLNPAIDASVFATLLQQIRPGWRVNIQKEYAVCYAVSENECTGTFSELLEETSVLSLLQHLWQSMEDKEILAGGYGVPACSEVWLHSKFGLSEWRPLHPRRMIRHCIGEVTADGGKEDWLEVFPSPQPDPALSHDEAAAASASLRSLLSSSEASSSLKRWLLTTLVWQFRGIFVELLYDGTLPRDHLKTLPLNELPSELFYRCAAAVLESSTSTLADREWMALARGIATRGLDVSIPAQVETLQRLWRSLQPLLITATSELQAVEIPGSREWMLMHLHLPLLFRCFAVLQFTEAEPPTGFVDLVKSMVSSAWDALKELLPKALATAEDTPTRITECLGLLLSALTLAVERFQLFDEGSAGELLSAIPSDSLDPLDGPTSLPRMVPHRSISIPVYFGFTAQTHKPAATSPGVSGQEDSGTVDQSLKGGSETKEEESTVITGSTLNAATVDPSSIATYSYVIRPWRRVAMVPVPSRYINPIKIAVDAPDKLLPGDCIVVSAWRRGRWTEVSRIERSNSASTNSITITQRIQALRMELVTNTMEQQMCLPPVLPPMIRLTVKTAVPAEEVHLPTKTAWRATLVDLLIQLLYNRSGSLLAQFGTQPQLNLNKEAAAAHGKVLKSPLLQGGIQSPSWQLLHSIFFFRDSRV